MGKGNHYNYMYQFLFLPCKVSTCGFNIVYCLFASPFDCLIPALKTLSRHLWATSTVNIIQQSCCFLSYCPLKVLLCILSAIKQPTGNLYLCTTDKPLLIILSYIMHADISNCAVAMPRKKLSNAGQTTWTSQTLSWDLPDLDVESLMVAKNPSEAAGNSSSVAARLQPPLSNSRLPGHYHWHTQEWVQTPCGQITEAPRRCDNLAIKTYMH